ncbi:MAG: hypothetical protein A4E38_01936 [Methanoregulaceae archaeon PtaB.Bin108]|nr:MAG: hypothetical protein A4E38_01936 [Methanoregulaceae archaeon PtaB.Bin108]
MIPWSGHLYNKMKTACAVFVEKKIIIAVP